eukprot:170873-Chlamydomonas_euryale.AAC.1
MKDYLRGKLRELQSSVLASGHAPPLRATVAGHSLFFDAAQQPPPTQQPQPQPQLQLQPQPGAPPPMLLTPQPCMPHHSGAPLGLPPGAYAVVPPPGAYAAVPPQGPAAPQQMFHGAPPLAADGGAGSKRGEQFHSVPPPKRGAFRRGCGSKVGGGRVEAGGRVLDAQSAGGSMLDPRSRRNLYGAS